mgnify:CR=1 FL=1
MNRQGHETAAFFVGTEVEHSPVHGHRTLFVIGLQPVDQILWQIGEHDRANREPITHVYFGANHSFPSLAYDDADAWQSWETMIQSVLDQGYWCTLDLDVQQVPGLCEGGLVEHAQFVPMISVKMPYVRLLGYNATVKIDDSDFAATNAGVWCHSLHDLMDRQRFTSWNQYTKDTVIK